MLNPVLREKLKFFMEKDVKILRGMVYKELMEWKRALWEKEGKLNVDGELRKAMALTEEEKAFIDEEVAWFLLGEIPDSLRIPYAKQTLESLQGNSNLSAPQRQLKQDLESALTVGAPPVSKDEDVPF